ncbi:hypothetical protein [Roseimaritima ulvae]|uniref:Uncharacterized protein n=1 Tax=Roseimaritima ulvae TaxID=980254 RepID=A0A5B9QSA5_9BACT|nr:hypothetical protein [Roseimaritima ulvae]QEG41987.1 hypothetical protein UC8_40160 [Roseimaritima ulvae]
MPANDQSDQHQQLATRRQWLSGLLAMLSTAGVFKAAAAIDPLLPRFRHTFGGTLPCLPRHDYQHHAHSPTILSPSYPAQLITVDRSTERIETAAPLDALRDVELNLQRKRFRPIRTQLRIDHCRVSDVVVDIENSGMWVMSLLAEQNPPLEPEQDRRFQQRLHIKRNAFDFQVRFHAAQYTQTLTVRESDEMAAEPQAGRLVAARVHPDTFWVQRQRPRNMRWSGYSREIARFFADIQSAEFEFSYRLDPLSAAGENVRRLDGP